jgi:hypothetical protein
MQPNSGSVAAARAEITLQPAAAKAVKKKILCLIEDMDGHMRMSRV